MNLLKQFSGRRPASRAQTASSTTPIELTCVIVLLAPTHGVYFHLPYHLLLFLCRFLASILMYVGWNRRRVTRRRLPGRPVDADSHAGSDEWGYGLSADACESSAQQALLPGARPRSVSGTAASFLNFIYQI